jgi:hypothetical protein
VLSLEGVDARAVNGAELFGPLPLCEEPRPKSEQLGIGLFDSERSAWNGYSRGGDGRARQEPPTA